MDGAVEVGKEGDRRDPARGQLGQGGLPRRDDRPDLTQTLGVAVLGGGVFNDGAQVGGEVGGERRLVGEGEPLGILLDEEVEGVDDHQVGDEADGDVELAHPLGEDEAREPVAEGVLLPVEEVAGRRDVEGVGLDRGAAVRGGAQPDHVRSDVHRLGEVVRRAVFEGHLDRHVTSVPAPGYGCVTETARERGAVVTVHVAEGASTGRARIGAGTTDGRNIDVLSAVGFGQLSRRVHGPGSRPIASIWAAASSDPGSSKTSLISAEVCR
nr:hypothetical protein [Lapillicoccus sp.]